MDFSSDFDNLSDEELMRIANQGSNTQGDYGNGYINPDELSDEELERIANGGDTKPIYKFESEMWADGDGLPSAYSDGRTNEWGGNLRNDGRRVLFRTDDAGKINGYSTTTSTIAPTKDGKYAVIPTVVNGQQLSEDDAYNHYLTSGEYWGKSDTLDEAKALSNAIHEKHMADNIKPWNDFIHDHWKDMSTEIRKDPKMIQEHVDYETAKNVEPNRDCSSYLSSIIDAVASKQGREDALDIYRRQTRNGDMADKALGIAADMGNSFWAGLLGGIGDIGEAVGNVVSDDLKEASQKFKSGVDGYFADDMLMDKAKEGEDRTWAETAYDVLRGAFRITGEYAPMALGGGPTFGMIRAFSKLYGATLIGAGGINTYNNTVDYARENGVSDGTARALGSASGVCDVLTNAFLMSKFKNNWMDNKKFFKNFTTRLMADTLITSGVMGVSGGAQDVIDQMAKNDGYSLEKTGNAVVDNLIEGALFHLANMIIHLPVSWSKIKDAERTYRAKSSYVADMADAKQHEAEAAEKIQAERERYNSEEACIELINKIGDESMTIDDARKLIESSIRATEEAKGKLDHQVEVDAMKSEDEITNEFNRRQNAERELINRPDGLALLLQNNPDAVIDITMARRRGEDVTPQMMKDFGVPHIWNTQDDMNSFGDWLLHYTDEMNAGRKLSEAKRNGEAVKEGQTIDKYNREISADNVVQSLPDEYDAFLKKNNAKDSTNAREAFLDYLNSEEYRAVPTEEHKKIAEPTKAVEPEKVEKKSVSEEENVGGQEDKLNTDTVETTTADKGEVNPVDNTIKNEPPKAKKVGKKKAQETAESSEVDNAESSKEKKQELSKEEIDRVNNDEKMRDIIARARQAKTDAEREKIQDEFAARWREMFDESSEEESGAVDTTTTSTGKGMEQEVPSAKVEEVNADNGMSKPQQASMKSPKAKNKVVSEEPVSSIENDTTNTHAIQGEKEEVHVPTNDEMKKLKLELAIAKAKKRDNNPKSIERFNRANEAYEKAKAALGEQQGKPQVAPQEEVQVKNTKATNAKANVKQPQAQVRRGDTAFVMRNGKPQKVQVVDVKKDGTCIVREKITDPKNPFGTISKDSIVKTKDVTPSGIVNRGLTNAERKNIKDNEHLLSSDDDLRYSRSGKKLDEDTDTKNAIADRLKKLVPGIKSIRFEQPKDRDGNDLQGVNGMFDRKNGLVVINPNATSDAVVHEVGGHAVRLWAEKHCPEMFRKSIDYALNAPKEIKDFVFKHYGDFSNEAVLDEIFAHRFAKEHTAEFERMVNEKPEVKTWWGKITDSIKNIFTDAAKRNGVDTESIKDLSSDEYVKRITEQLIAGKELNEYTAFGRDAKLIGKKYDISAVPKDEDGTMRFSMATYEDEGRKTLNDWLDKSVAKGEIDQKDAKDIMVATDTVFDIMKKFAGKKEYASFGKWSKAKVELDEKGRPYFGVIRTNGDYAFNIDFSTVCKKRRPLDAVFSELVKQGIVNERNISNLLSKTNIPKIQEIIKKHGLEVACALCFVDAKRYTIGQDVKTFSNLWNRLVSEKSSGGEKWNDRIKYAVDKKTYLARCIREIESYKGARVKVDPAQLIDGSSFDEFVKNYPAVAKMYRSFRGQAKAKESTLDVPYNNDIIKMFKHSLNPDVPKSISPNQAYSVGGVRLQSFSDFVPRLVFDYVQMFADLAARKLPLHTYTKETDLVRLFGKTGAKINMSLVPNGTGIKWLTNAEMKKQRAIPVWSEGSTKDRPVLVKKDGKVACFDFADECFPPEEAFKMRSSDGNVGTIMVGVSDEHIKMCLADPRIDMVIPYHKSSINPIVAQARGIDMFTDYTNGQHTKGIENGGEFDFYGDLGYPEHPGTNDPIRTTKNYLAWCKKRGFTPKFTKFTGDKNYYKLLADFRLYDDAGNYSPQTEVHQVNPDARWQRDVKAALIHDNEATELLRKEMTPIIKEIKEAVFKIEKSSNDNPAKEDIRYSRVTDKDRLDNFREAQNEGRTVKTVRSFIRIGDKLYSPMAAMTKGEDGKYHLSEPVGTIINGKLYGYLQKADENPNLAFWDNGKYRYKLKKEEYAVDENGEILLDKNGKKVKLSPVTALYNSYWHSSDSPLNDQFTSAYKRPNLVTVECEILKDESVDGKKLLNDGTRPETDLYWAEKSNNSIGRHDWHKGPVAKDMPKENRRHVYLTRELMPMRIMSDAETADIIIDKLGANLNKSGAYDGKVFPPGLSRELEKRGMKIEHGVDADGIRYSRDKYDDSEDGREYSKKYSGTRVESDVGSNLRSNGAAGNKLADFLEKRSKDGEKDIVRYARKNGIYDIGYKIHKKDAFDDGEKDKHGMETTHVVRNGENVFKYRRPDSSIEAESEKVAYHNELFGERTPYSIVGIHDGGDGAQVVLRQPHVSFKPNSGEDARKALTEELRERFGDAKRDGVEIHSGGWIIDDLKDANIGIDSATGKPAVIDAIIHRDTEYGGDGDDIRFSRGVPYQGSKGRISDKLVKFFPRGKRFVDLMAGGGAVTHSAMRSGKYGSYHMNDIDGRGVRLFTDAINGRYDNYDRTSMTEEEFAKIRDTPEALMWSYNGLGRNLANADMEGRDRAGEQVRRVKGLSELRPMANKVTTSFDDYHKYQHKEGDVVYVDKPYSNTDTLGYGAGKKFDHEEFDKWAKAQNYPIIVSEYSMPEGWTEIADIPTRGMRGGERHEKLFVQDKFADEVKSQQDDDIRYSRTSPTPNAILDEKESFGSKFRRAIQDNLLDWRTIQDKVGGVHEDVDASGRTDKDKSTNFYEAKDKQNGYVERDMRELQGAYDSIIGTLVDNGISNDEMNKFLVYRHAEERNRQKAKELGIAFDPTWADGAGISSKDANQILTNMRNTDPRWTYFEQAGRMWDKLTHEDLVRRHESGRLSDEEFNRLTTAYSHYAPLREDMSNSELDMFGPSTKGFKKNELLRAKGRSGGSLFDASGNLTVDPLTFGILQAEEGIRGSEENRSRLVLRNLINEAQANGTPIGEIVDGTKVNGTSSYGFKFPDGDYVSTDGSLRVPDRDDIVLFKENGKLKAIRMELGEHGRGLSLGRAANGNDMMHWAKPLEWVPRLTRAMSAMRTQYVPTFILRNAKADLGEALTALTGRYGVKELPSFMKDVTKSMIDNRKDLVSYFKTGTTGGYVKEAIDGGLLTKGGVASQGYDGMYEAIQNKREKLERMTKTFGTRTLSENAKHVLFDILGDKISFANELAENNTRIALFSALRKRGVSVPDAVKFARDATVNFNRRGYLTPWINGVYMFSNAATQGFTRNIQAFGDDKGKELMIALGALGVAEGLINHYFGNDDDREKKGESNAKNMSPYELKHTIGVPIGGGRQAIWQTRGLYATLPYIGKTLVAATLGEIDPSTAAKRLFVEAGDILTEPIAGNGISNEKEMLNVSTLLQSLSPSLIDPFVQWGTGKDYKGDDRLRKSFNSAKPKSFNGKLNTGDAYKFVAETLNRLTGGSKDTKGYLDIAPEDVQLLADTILGGIGRDISNTLGAASTAKAIAKGESPERVLSSVPSVRDFVREYPRISSRYYDAVDKINEWKTTFRGLDSADRAKFIRKHPLANGRMNKTISRIKDLTHLSHGEGKTKTGKYVQFPYTTSQRENARKEAMRLMSIVVEEVEK